MVIKTSNVSLNLSAYKPEQLKKLETYLKIYKSIQTKENWIKTRKKVSNCVLTWYNSGKLLIQGDNAETIKYLILKQIDQDEFRVFGIDEVGRGENTGALVVCGVLGNNKNMIEFRDSKKSNNFHLKFKQATEKSDAFIIFGINAKFIDEIRRSGSNLNSLQTDIMNAMSKFIKKYDKTAKVIADGKRLFNTDEIINFEPKADDKYPVVSASSCVAKFIREYSGDKGLRQTWKNSHEL